MQYLYLALLFLLATVTHGAPTTKDGEPIVLTFNITLPPFTAEIFTNWTNGFLQEAQGYIPAELETELRDMVKPENQREVQDFTSFVTNVLNGKTKLPTKPKAALKVLKKNIPQTYARIERVQKALDAKYDSLSQPAKDFLADFERMADQIEVPHNENQTAVNFVHFVVNENNKFNNLNNNIKNEFNNKYPDVIKVLNAPNVQLFINKLIEVNNRSNNEILTGLGQDTVQQSGGSSQA